MKYLLDFLQSDVEKSIIFPSLECNVDETKILKHLCSCYIDGVSTVSVFTVLCAVFGNKDYKFLEHLGDIKTLFELGYIVQNSSGFKGIEQKLKGGTLELLFVEIELSGLFLKLLEEGSLDEFELKIEPYNDHLEYLQDQFYRIELFFRRLSSTSEKNKKRLNQRIKLASETIEKKLKISKIQINIEQIFKYNSLNEKEKIIFLALLKEEYGGDMEGSRDLNTLIGLVSDSEISRIKNRSLLDEGSNLVSSGLIDYDELIMPFGGVGRSFFITENILGEIIHPGDKKMTKKLRLENMVKDSEIFELIEPKTDIDDVVLNPKTKELFKNILRQLDRRVLSRLTSWGIKSRRGVDAKIIFYGPPGTGKTLSALSLAKSLKKLVLSFDCSKILSKYVGESEQNVRKIFDIYKEICSKNKIEPVLLLNEADQFLSTRIDGSVSGGEKMHNQMQNIFLEQIEKFEGVLIATTNFLESLDKAFSRRFDYKVEFKKPNFDERLAIWRKIMPENANFEENFDIKELAKFELSGAQIVLALKNTALKVAIRDDGIFTLKDFIVEIGREISGGFDEDAKKVGLL